MVSVIGLKTCSRLAIARAVAATECGCLLRVSYLHPDAVEEPTKALLFLRFDTSVGQKVGYSSFQCPVWTYVVIWIVGFIITLATGAVEWVVLLPMFFAFFYAIGLRIHVANKENIQEFGGCFGEFCCGFWCWYCSVAQSKMQTQHSCKFILKLMCSRNKC
jgi:hypothetical protein